MCSAILGFPASKSSIFPKIAFPPRKLILLFLLTEIGSISVLCKHAHMNHLTRNQNYAKSKIIHTFNRVIRIRENDGIEVLLIGQCISVIAHAFFGVFGPLNCNAHHLPTVEWIIFFQYDIAIIHERASGFTSITVLCTLSCFFFFFCKNCNCICSRNLSKPLA